MTQTYVTYAALGLKKKPWPEFAPSADTSRIADTVNAALQDRAMIAIIGPRGVGKSRAMENLLPNGTRIIEPISLDRKRLTIDAIAAAIVYDLGNGSGEKPARDGEARSRQIRRILGEAGKPGTQENPVKIALIIDDAHKLHHQTKGALKRLMELKFVGRPRLLTIIMLAQSDPLHGIDEVRLRTDNLHLEGLSRQERSDYLTNAIGDITTPDAITALAGLPDAGNYLDLQAAADSAMAAAVAAGHDKVKLVDVFTSTGGGLSQVADMTGTSLAQLQQATGKSKTQVSRVMSGDRTDPEAERRIRDYLNQQLGKQPAPDVRKTA